MANLDALHDAQVTMRHFHRDAAMVAADWADRHLSRGETEEYLMGTFRVLTIDRSGHIFGIDEIEARDDQEAIDQVSKLCACQIGYGYEIWQGNRQVCTHFESRLSHH